MKYTIIYPFWQILLTKYLPCGKSMADSEPISRSYYIRSDSTGKLENIKVIFDLPGGVQTEGRFRLRPPGVPASQAPHRTQHAEYGAPGKGQFLLMGGILR